MQNKVIQTSNMKQKKENETSKAGLAIINTILTNNIELSKHKSHEIYGQYSPSNLTNNNNNITNNNNIISNNNNQKKNYTLANTINKIIHYSGVKKNNIQNETKNIKSKSKKEYGNININDISNQMNNNKDNLSENKNEINKTKKIKLDNILSESDSCQEIDSMEEENLSKGMKYSNKNIKRIHNMKRDSLNYERHLTTGINYTNNKNSEIMSIKDNINKQSPSNYKNNNKISGKKKTKKLKITDDNEDTDEEIIVNDNEFDNSRFISNDKLIETKFPKLSSNPFIGQKKSSIKSDEYKKSISSKEYGPKSKNNERQKISSHHIKSTTLGTIIQSNTNHNSNNLSNTIDFLNFNLNNNTDEIYKNFLITAKNGDNEKFLEILEQINSLPENIKNINYQDEKGFSALHYSCDEGNFKIVVILLKANCETNIKNKEKKTPLHLAAQHGYFDISKKLIASGALLNIFDVEENTPLHYVCMNNHVELFRFFLSKLPKADTKNIYGKRPIDLTTNKDIKEALIEYMKKNENSYHKIKIYQTTDSKMNNLIEKQKKLKSIEENKDNKRINTSSKKSKNSSLSPNSKKKNNKNQVIIRTQDYNSVQNTSTTSNINKKRTINVELKKSKYINLDNINETNNNINITKSNEKISPKKGNNKSNIDPNLKTSKLKTSTKSKDNEINNNKKNKKVHMHEQNTINNNHKIKKNHLSNKNNNHNNLLNYNNKFINVLKKTKTVEQFSSGKSNNHLNQTNININHSNKRNEALNDSKLNSTNVAIININNSINNELNRINLSFSSTKNEKTKLNSSKSKENKQDNSNNKISPDNKSKVFNNEVKYKKLIFEQFESASNIINLNKTQENINNVSQIAKKSLKNSQVVNQNKSKDNKKNENNIDNNTFSNKSIRILDSKEKKISGSKTKKKQKHNQENNQSKKLENISRNSKVNHVPNPQSPHQININLENSYNSQSPTNNNISKISQNNKNRINFDPLDKSDKSNIADQTLQDNIHAQLNLNSIEEEERITPSSFICLAQLGKGSFGEVYLVQKINTKEKFAMKVLRKERIMGQNLLKYAIAERNVLSVTNHPFIVKLNFAVQTSSKLFLILEYCSNGDLAKHLLFEKRFSEDRAKFYICEVLLALENLHQRDIIFRDLKPDNVVLDQEGHCKLTDFGLSKEGVTENQSASSFCGSVAYLAPEMLKKQGHGKAVDWYLLGVLLYEMLLGITPFYTNRKEDIFHNIEFGELKIPEFIREDTKSLLRGLLQKDPKKRLGGGNRDAEEIKQHPYFKDVNWDDVYYKRITPPPVNVFTKNIMHVYQRPRLFANDDNMNRSSDKSNPNMLPGWSFINNEE